MNINVIRAFTNICHVILELSVCFFGRKNGYFVSDMEVAGEKRERETLVAAAYLPRRLFSCGQGRKEGREERKW